MAKRPTEFAGPSNMIFRFLTDDGLVGGESNMGVNGSVTPVDYYFAPSSTQVAIIERAIVHIEDNSVVKSETYGAISALANGVTVQVQDSGGNTILDLTPVAITSNADWGHYCFDVGQTSFDSTSVNKTVQARWTFSRSGNPIKLEGRYGHRLVVTINDNLSTLVDHKINIQGYFIDP